MYLQTLFESSVTKGFNKSKIYEKDKSRLLEKINKLEEETTTLRKEVEGSKDRLLEVEMRERKDVIRRRKERKNSCERIHRANLQLKRQIESILFK